MLLFHETETCEGIIQHLEQRRRERRSDVQIRDSDGETSADARVEMTFRLGAQLYALEHTGIEPFDGFVAHQNRASSLFQPLQTAATALVGTVLANGVVIEMHLVGAARRLYTDKFTGRPTRGAGAKGSGSPRRLALIANQLALTYDIRDMPTENFLRLLPEEFAARW